MSRQTPAISLVPDDAPIKTFEDRTDSAGVRREAAIFRYLARLSPIPVALTHRDTSEILFKNPEFDRVFGATIASGKEALALYEDPEARSALVAKVIAENGVRNEPVRFRRSDGTIGDFLVSMLPASIDGLSLLYTYALDVSDRVSAENHLRTRTEEMSLILDNVSEGLCIIDGNGLVRGEASGSAIHWLGAVPAGTPIGDAIAAKDQPVGQWFSLAWDAVRDAILPLEVTLAQLPHMMRVDGNHIELMVRPIGTYTEHDRPEAYLVILADVSESIAKKSAESQQRALLNIFEHVLRDRGAVVDFIADSDAINARIRAIPIESGTISRKDIVEFRRDVHTLKGNYGLFGLEHLALACHELEEALDGTMLTRPEALEELLSGWEAFRERARTFVDNHEADIDVTREDVAELREALRRGAPGDQLLRLIDAWKQQSVKRRLERIRGQATALARRLKKGQLRFVAEANALRLPVERWGPFWSVLAHVIRNAIDHGLEYPDDRVAAGKSRNGLVRVTTYATGDDVVVEVCDDGRGIDWDRIRSVARSRDLPAETHTQLIDALFTDGLTTRTEVSETSGRGVGMAAVKACVLSMGGTIEVTSERGRGSTFRFSIPNVEVPPSSAASSVR